MMGFACKQCASSEPVFQLSASVALQVSVSVHGEWLLQLAGQPAFAADLGFMNRFARCGVCGSVGQWRYSATATLLGFPASPSERKSPQTSTPRKLQSL